MNIHDSGYKLLFSNRTIFRQLIESFVEEEWVQLLDFDRSVRIDKSFISEEYQENESDLIYQVPLRTGVGAVLFYLLIEFQSSVERFMALRTGDYLTSLYLDYWRSQEGVRLLPQVFPIVLYNGSDRWTAPETLNELIEQMVDLGDYGVQVRYFPIIVNKIPLERLLEEANTVSTLFMAEAHYDKATVVKKIVDLHGNDDSMAVSLLANWFKQMTVHKRIPVEDWALLEREYRSKEELETMLVDALKKEEAQLLNRGIEIGEVRGEARGETKGRLTRDREIAAKMAAANYPLATIADLLGISQDDVQRLLMDEGDALNAVSSR